MEVISTLTVKTMSSGRSSNDVKQSVHFRALVIVYKADVILQFSPAGGRRIVGSSAGQSLSEVGMGIGNILLILSPLSILLISQILYKFPY